MPEWLLWVLFAVVLLPVALEALCLALIYAAVLSVWLKVQYDESPCRVQPLAGPAGCDRCNPWGAVVYQKKESRVEKP